jgi:hypothetical protein
MIPPQIREHLNRLNAITKTEDLGHESRTQVHIPGAYHDYLFIRGKFDSHEDFPNTGYRVLSKNHQEHVGYPWDEYDNEDQHNTNLIMYGRYRDLLENMVRGGMFLNINGHHVLLNQIHDPEHPHGKRIIIDYRAPDGRHTTRGIGNGAQGLHSYNLPHTSESEQLGKAVLENPHEDSPRHMLIDHLIENDEPGRFSKRRQASRYRFSSDPLYWS